MGASSPSCTSELEAPTTNFIFSKLGCSPVILIFTAYFIFIRYIYNPSPTLPRSRSWGKPRHLLQRGGPAQRNGSPRPRCSPLAGRVRFGARVGCTSFTCNTLYVNAYISRLYVKWLETTKTAQVNPNVLQNLNLLLLELSISVTKALFLLTIPYLLFPICYSLLPIPLF